MNKQEGPSLNYLCLISYIHTYVTLQGITSVHSKTVLSIEDWYQKYVSSLLYATYILYGVCMMITKAKNLDDPV